MRALRRRPESDFTFTVRIVDRPNLCALPFVARMSWFSETDESVPRNVSLSSRRTSSEEPFARARKPAQSWAACSWNSESVAIAAMQRVIKGSLARFLNCDDDRIALRGVGEAAHLGDVKAGKERIRDLRRHLAAGGFEQREGDVAQRDAGAAENRG